MIFSVDVWMFCFLNNTRLRHWSTGLKKKDLMKENYREPFNFEWFTVYRVACFKN